MLVPDIEAPLAELPERRVHFTRTPSSEHSDGWSSPESGQLTLKHPTLSGLGEDITAAIALLECAEEKIFKAEI
jgi:hypothetical protein